MPGASPVIIPVKQRTPEWLAARENGIGASQAAAAIDMSPWQSRIGLWAEKLGLIPPPEQNIPMRIGSELEPLIARLYTEATGIKVRRANLLRQHPQHAFMLASIDRRAGRKPIELKYSARGDGYGDPGTDEVPDEVLVQVLHQMAVVGEDEADVAAVIGRRDGIQIYTIHRDAAVESAIIEREAEFWHHVETRTEPPLDGSEATRAYLRARYPVDDGAVLEADEQLARMLGDLRAIRQEQDAAGVRRAELEVAIQAAMGTASKVVAPGVGSITWKATKDRETVEWKSIADVYTRTVDSLVGELRRHVESLLLEGVDVTTDEGLESVHAALRSLYTTTKPGPRMFGPPRWEEED